MEAYNYVDFLESKTDLRQIEIGAPAPEVSGEIPQLVHALLVALGEDPDREGLVRTPERVARAYQELLSGYQTDLDALVNGALFDSDYEDIVMVRNIEFYSMCEHHLLPFFGRAHVAYIPDRKIIGLSKIPRLVEMYARRLQVQEVMTSQIAHTLDAVLRPKGVAVLVQGAHLCARMRGVKQEQADMVTRTTLGIFNRDQNLRREVFSQLPVEQPA